MKNHTEAVRKRPADIVTRIREIDASLASLDERIEKNKAGLECNNASLTVKIAELWKTGGSKRRSSKS